MLCEFPYMIPQDKHGRHYDGYIMIGKQSYRLEVIIPPSGRLRDASLNCDWSLQQILCDNTGVIQKRLTQSSSLLSFLKEVKSILEHQLQGHSEGEGQIKSQICRHLIGHIEELGWDRLLTIGPSFDHLELKHVDQASRPHVLKISIGSQYPGEAPRFYAELPGKFEPHWNAKSRLLEVYHQFQQTVAMYQEFWDMIDEIDTHTWVLEPDKPTRNAVHRRLAVSSSASVQITVDPSHPRVLPECRFMGADQAITPLRQSMNANIPLWDEGQSLLTNLQNLLDIIFPSPANSRKEEFSVECGICYTYRLELQIPSEVCNDSRCGQAFHQLCLYEWLRALPSSRQSFNTIFGECPYCEKSITVKMPVK